MFPNERWAVFISGRGSNLRALLQNHSEKIKLVVSSKPSSQGLRIARRYGVPVKVLSPKVDWEMLQNQLGQFSINRVFLAGFMKVLPESFLSQWKNKILNVHPSLLPAYPGLKSMQRSYDDNSDMGVTVHEVIPEVDAGSVLLQKISLQEPQRCEFAEATFKTHLVEQKLVSKAVGRWRSCECS